MWRKVPPQDATRDIGTTWLKDLASAVLVVPSSIIPEERNFLLNPLHPDFSKILISHPQSFSFDNRIAKILLG
jgi:RES domain-containing protein